MNGAAGCTTGMISESILIVPLQDILRGAVGQGSMKKEDCLHMLGFLETVIEAKVISRIIAAALGMEGPEVQGRALMGFGMMNKYQPLTLYFIHEDGVLIAGALIMGHTINRIGTIDTHRHKGYATKLIKCIEQIAKEDKWPVLFSPVNPELQGLFRKIGWEDAAELANPDGSIDMKPRWSSY